MKTQSQTDHYVKLFFVSFAVALLQMTKVELYEDKRQTSKLLTSEGAFNMRTLNWTSWIYTSCMVLTGVTPYIPTAWVLMDSSASD